MLAISQNMAYSNIILPQNTLNNFQEQIVREKTVSGRVQLQVWFHGERNELVVSLMAADDLSPRDDSLGHGNLPEAYAKVKISPKVYDNILY